MPRTQNAEITEEFFNELHAWIATADMFLASPEGRAFGKKLEAVVNLAQEKFEEYK